MPRPFRPLVVVTLTCALLVVPTRADDPPKKLTAAERKELLAKFLELNDAGARAYQAGKYPEAAKALRDALEATRRLYPKADFPNGHDNLITSLNNLALVYRGQGKSVDA